MKKAVACIAVAAGILAGAQLVSAADKPLIGIVSIAATEANNVRYINGATKAAEELGWEVSVIDADGSADRANAGIQNFAQRGAHAIIDMVFPFSSIGAGLDAAKSAGIPVVTWGGGLGSTVAATNGSGGPMAVPVVEMMVKELGGKGSVLALTYRTGEVCRNREVVMDEILAKNPDIKVTKNEVRIPGYFEDGAQYANAWLTSHPAGSEPLAIWGCWDDPDRRHRLLARARPRRREGLRHQRQRPGAGEHPQRPHDRDRLAGQLHRGLQHGEDAGRDQKGRRRLAAQGG